MFKFLAALAAAFFASNCCAETLTLDPKRTVEVIDVIDASAIPLAQQIEDLSTQSRAPIYVLLNSPGGSTLTGFTIADAMIAARARGSKLVCVSGVLAASMAFNLFAYCDERYALAHAKLLFHPVRVGSQEGLTVAEMLLLTPQMQRLEARNKDALREMMGAGQAWFDAHYYAETLWEAEDLVDQTPNNWLTIVDAVKGTDKLFTIQKPRLGMFGMQLPSKDVWPTNPKIINGGRP